MQGIKYKFVEDSANKKSPYYMPQTIYFGRVIYEDDVHVMYKCPYITDVLVIKKIRYERNN